MVHNKTQTIKNNTGIWNIFLNTTLFLILLLASIGYLPTDKALAACGSPDACERAAASCEANGGVWVGTTGNCTPTPRYNCITTGGDPQTVQTNQPGAPDGLELRCVCPDTRVLENERCVLPGSADDAAAPTANLDIRPDPERDCQTENGEDLTADNCGIINMLNIVFNFVSGAISLAVIGNIIVAGIQYSSAQGDPGAAAKAKTRIRNALLAFLMYLSLFGFIQWLIPGGVF